MGYDLLRLTPGAWWIWMCDAAFVVTGVKTTTAAGDWLQVPSELRRWYSSRSE